MLILKKQSPRGSVGQGADGPQNLASSGQEARAQPQRIGEVQRVLLRLPDLARAQDYLHSKGVNSTRGGLEPP